MSKLCAREALLVFVFGQKEAGSEHGVFFGRAGGVGAKPAQHVAPLPPVVGSVRGPTSRYGTLVGRLVTWALGAERVAEGDAGGRSRGGHSMGVMAAPSVGTLLVVG